MALEVADCRILVLAHEPAVAGDISGKNGSEPTLSREFFVHHLLPGAAVDVGDSAGGIVAHRVPGRKEHSPFKPYLRGGPTTSPPCDRARARRVRPTPQRRIAHAELLRQR
jgi:hypothetical protein